MNKVIPLLLGVSMLPMSALTLAQPVAQPDTIIGPISAFHGNARTLVHAIRAIQHSTGGKVVDIRFSDSHGAPGYHAVVVKRGRVEFFHIADRSNRATEIDATSGPVWMLGWRSRADLHFAKEASVPLTKAIWTAEQSQNGAPALAAGIARDASNPGSNVHAYTVLLDVNGAVRSVSVDDATGEVIANPDALKG
jgi:uncharacterized membrane protein YkoI